ncbi:MAG: DUF4242 domain-containing protein [Deltaproteobacteria bacterium]|nr:DUF4242 domain-containing protein [Deltaproteobacteria bacterium]
MPKFLTIHREPEKTLEKMEEAYKQLAKETTAVWVRTYYRKEDGRRICEWEAPSEESIMVVFKRTGITWDEMIEVEEVLPGRWR